MYTFVWTRFHSKAFTDLMRTAGVFCLVDYGLRHYANYTQFYMLVTGLLAWVGLRAVWRASVYAHVSDSLERQINFLNTLHAPEPPPTADIISISRRGK